MMIAIIVEILAFPITESNAEAIVKYNDPLLIVFTIPANTPRLFSNILLYFFLTSDFFSFALLIFLLISILVSFFILLEVF